MQPSIGLAVLICCCCCACCHPALGKTCGIHTALHEHSAARAQWPWRQRLRAQRWLAIAASYACAFAPAAVAIATAAVARRLPPLPPAEHSQAAPDRLSRGHRSAPALRSAHRAWSYFPSYATATVTVTGQVKSGEKTKRHLHRSHS